MAVDAAMRQLKIPPRFMPYMEKHRIYELFYDLGNQLAINQPEDQIVFLKNTLVKVNRGSRDRRIIVFMAPPSLDRIKLAQLLSVKTGCDILTRYLICLSPGNHYDPDSLAINTADCIQHSEKKSWILADYPDTTEEAKSLINAGVLPTHAFLFLTDEGECTVDTNNNLRTAEPTPSIQREFDNSILKLQELFKASLKIVKLNYTTINDVANSCARLVNKMPQVNVPKLFRIVLIGPRGSRRRSLAKCLHKLYNVVHVDMLQLINSVRRSECNVGDEVRYLDKNEYTYSKPLTFDLLKARLYKTDCLERGYVITNFPWCLEDLVILDSIDTPPNKVIFLDINGDVCLKRLNDRVVNMYTGTIYTEKIIKDDVILNSQCVHHPDDEECKVAEEIKFYKQNVKAMMDYCGNTCSVIDAKGPFKSLLERIEAVLMSPSPIGKPRSWKIPYTSSIQTELSIDDKMALPASRTEIVLPLTDSADLINRFKRLKANINSDDECLDALMNLKT